MVGLGGLLQSRRSPLGSARRARSQRAEQASRASLLRRRMSLATFPWRGSLGEVGRHCPDICPVAAPGNTCDHIYLAAPVANSIESFNRPPRGDTLWPVRYIAPSSSLGMIGFLISETVSSNARSSFHSRCPTILHLRSIRGEYVRPRMARTLPRPDNLG